MKNFLYNLKCMIQTYKYKDKNGYYFYYRHLLKYDIQHFIKNILKTNK